MKTRLSRLPLWQRFLLAAVILPPLLAGSTAGAYYIGLHQRASSESISDLPLFPTPQKGHRYLVLAPHCDDETLAVGGFIAEATRKGASVSVAFMTNGDGFPAAATRELKEVNLSPADYVRFAERRQTEAKRAEQTLGVDEKNVYFLGYPDRGLRPMWETNWDKTPYRSYYTGHTHSPYPVSFTPHTEYCGVNLQNDLVRLMNQVRPTDIFVTHPADDHPDHSAAASFAQSAFRVCTEERKDNWAQAAKMHYYIVHRGDWPLPQGKRLDGSLTPPPGLTTTDTKWRAYLLSDEAQKAKDKALSHYVSQLNICSRFLTSFVRTNELFGEMDAPHVPATPEKWTTVALDGRRDDVVRYVDPSADLTGIAVRRINPHQLSVRVSVRGAAVPQRLRYTLLLRTGTNPTTDEDVRTVSLSIPAGTQTQNLETVVPVPVPTDAENDCVWIAAETRYQAAASLPVRPVDRIGYRPFILTADHENTYIPTDKNTGKSLLKIR